MFCINCGSEIKQGSKICEYCGFDLSKQLKSQQKANNQKYNDYQTHTTTKTEIYVTPAAYSSYSPYGQVSPKSRIVLIILWFFFGVLGVHYFYAGRIGMGILWLLTGGLFGIGWIIDIIVILTGGFRDSHGRRIVNL
jgi:hypothetical protein